MDNELKTKWVAALRSGEFEQTHSILHVQQDDKHSYCCLGVLCKMMGAEFTEWTDPDDNECDYINRPVLDGKNLAYLTDEELTSETLKSVGLTPEDQTTLVRMNDGWQDTTIAKQVRQHTFEEIAEHIEKNL